MSLLFFGGRGWIGQQFLALWDGEVVLSNNRVDDTEAVEKEIDEVKPSFVVCMTGRTHGPGCNTIDWLEKDRSRMAINVRDNLFAPVSLSLLCRRKGVHFTYLGTGCIFSGYEQKYAEEDEPDFFGSSYSVIKGFTDRLMHQMPGTLQLRIRMPIVYEDNKRDFITKICGYEKVINRSNSMTVLPDHLPLFVRMIRNKTVGTYNCVNPGSISHVEVLELYKDIVDPDFTYKVMTVEEQDALLASERSNNELTTDKINAVHMHYFGEPFPSIKESIRRALRDRTCTK